MDSVAITSVAKPDFKCGALLPADRGICRNLLPGELGGIVLIQSDSAAILPAQLNGTTNTLIKKLLPTVELSE